MRAYYFTLLALINIFGIGQIKNFRPEFKPIYFSLATVFDGLEYRFALLFSSLILMAVCIWAGMQVTSQLARIFVFISLLLYTAVTISSGALTHLYQFWMWSSFLLAWSPSIKDDSPAELKNIYCLMWSGAQSIVLLMYGLSGLWKVIGFIAQLSRGETGIFSPHGLSYHYASEVIRAGANPLLGSWLLNHGHWQPLMSIAVVLLQLFCFVGIFNKALRHYLGFALICFHLSTYFFLSINYPTNFALIPVLFLMLPTITSPSRL